MVQKKERTCESPRTEKELAGLKKKKANVCRILSNQEKDSGLDNNIDITYTRDTLGAPKLK